MLKNFAINFAGRPIQRILRNWPWPVKKKVLYFEPLATGNGAQLIILSTPDKWLDALWAAYSWLSFARGLRLRFLVDGRPHPIFCQEAARLFPGAVVASTLDLIREGQGLPSYVRLFASQNTFGRKFAALFQISRDEDVIYSDSDILVFDHPTEVLNTKGPAYCAGGGGLAWNAPAILEYMKSEGIPFIPGFNSGLLILPRGCLDEQLTQNLISLGGLQHHFFEQSLLHALLSFADATRLPPQRYLLSSRGMYFWESPEVLDDVVASHFTGVIRHQMYLQGIPYLLSKLEINRRRSETEPKVQSTGKMPNLIGEG